MAILKGTLPLAAKEAKLRVNEITPATLPMTGKKPNEPGARAAQSAQTKTN
jgi:hypothetical protein